MNQDRAESPTQDEKTLDDELFRARRENRRHFRRRIAIIGVVLAVAAGIEWRRPIGVFAVGRWYAHKAGGPTVSVDDAMDMIEAGDALMIDVREPEEFAVSHWEGARPLPLSAIKREGWPANWPRDRPIIAYCTVGYRSGVAARLLGEQGLEARNLVGGILALTHTRPSLVNESGRTWTVHTWTGSYAWMLPPDYRATWSEQTAENTPTTQPDP